MNRQTAVLPADQPSRPVIADPKWDYHPALPLENAQIFVWPPNPLRMMKSIASNWNSLTGRVVILAMALFSWFFATPALNDIASSGNPGWIAQIYLRNMALLVVIAGGLHLYFFSYTGQGKKLKFDARPLIRNGRMFTFNDQVRDNVFWSLFSGVFFWSAFEAFLLWGMARGFAPMMAFSDNPIWFVALFALIPLWYSFYFYWVHRLLHWPPLYKRVHALHHRNINLGPWSGMAMHPVEHFIYLGSVLIHFVVPSHPLHVIFHLQFNVFISIFSHTGFEGLLVGGKKRIYLGYFFHQLHHRYFECNYGTDEMPWDKWFGTFHDGTADATRSVKERRRQIYAKQ